LDKMNLFEMSRYSIWLDRIATSGAYHDLIIRKIPKKLPWLWISDELRVSAGHDLYCDMFPYAQNGTIDFVVGKNSVWSLD
jgi:hypothetical protein